MAVIDGSSELGKLKEAALPFEGFCEGLVRVSVLKTLPTPDELERGAPDFLPASTPCENAGEFMARMHSGMPEDLRRYLAMHKTAWGDTPRQPVQACLTNLMQLMLHTIESMVSSSKGGRGFSANLMVTSEEMKNWRDQYWEVKEEKMDTKLD